MSWVSRALFFFFCRALGFLNDFREAQKPNGSSRIIQTPVIKEYTLTHTTVDDINPALP